MKHNLKISVSKKPNADGIVACRTIGVRERVLRFLFGTKQKVNKSTPCIGKNADVGCFSVCMGKCTHPC